MQWRLSQNSPSGMACLNSVSALIKKMDIGHPTILISDLARDHAVSRNSSIHALFLDSSKLLFHYDKSIAHL